MSHAVEATSGSHSNKQFYVVWVALLVLTGIEVWLAYNQFFTPVHMLEILLALSIVKAGMIIAYFMHLKYEYGPMKIVLMASLVACLVLMFTFFADAIRLLEMGTPTH